MILVLLFLYTEICQDVQPISNGWVTYSGHLVGDTVTYQCYNGYSMHGTMARHCLASGRWTGRGPRCESEETSIHHIMSYNTRAHYCELCSVLSSKNSFLVIILFDSA